jgi:hypothetical protein
MAGPMDLPGPGRRHQRPSRRGDVARPGRGHGLDTATQYRRFAAREARGSSAVYQMLAGQVASDTRLLTLIDQLPARKRQPNLVFAAVRYLGGPVDDFRSFRAWTVAEWERVQQTVRQRSVQTNEPGRCAVLLPLLAALPQPLALIEAGASAGLCLYPDRYRYRYDGTHGVGPAGSPVTIDCRTTGAVPLPWSVPTITWRAGVDLNPLDVRHEDDVRWLESLIWPDEQERLTRLRAAIRVAQAEPAHLVRGDLIEKIPQLVDEAPAGATTVVVHSSVLGYLPAEAQHAFAQLIRTLPCRWAFSEAEAALPSVARLLPRPLPDHTLVSVVALDGRPMAFAGSHGQFLDWLS